MSEYHKRPQDDLPYEQRMKHIIEHYRWLLEQNDRLAAYARKLEQTVSEQSEKLAKRTATNRSLSDRFVEKNRENKRLKAHIEWLEEKIKKLEEV